jgi:hypothetical protein
MLYRLWGRGGGGGGAERDKYGPVVILSEAKEA